MPCRPLFSIITVCRNSAGTIDVTLRSVAEQTCTLFEYIIIDGASTDATLQLVNTAPIPGKTVVSEPDTGIYDAMNKALDIARGEYYIFLNAGDTFHSPHTLQVIADAIMENDFPGVVYGQTDIVDDRRNRLADRHLQAPEHLTLDSFRQGMTVCHQAFIAYSRIVGPYNLKYRYSADYEWCIRCLQHSRRNVYIPQVLIDYLWQGETTRHRRRSLVERFRIMSKYYGFWPTVGRHFSFIPRYLRRRRLEKQFR